MLVKYQVSDDHLRGLIPDALIDKYSFWRTGPHTIYGYPDPDTDDNSVIVVSMQRTERGAGWCGVVRRLEACYEVATGTEASAANEHVSAARQPMTLLNLMEARRPSLHQNIGAVELLRHLSQLWAKIDELSHVLVWSASLGEVRTQQAVLGRALMAVPGVDSVCVNVGATRSMRRNSGRAAARQLKFRGQERPRRKNSDVQLRLQWFIRIKQPEQPPLCWTAIRAGARRRTRSIISRGTVLRSCATTNSHLSFVDGTRPEPSRRWLGRRG